MSAPPALVPPRSRRAGLIRARAPSKGTRMRKTYTATREFTLSTFAPPVNLGRGQPIVFDHMEFMGAEQREEVAAALGTGALAPITREAADAVRDDTARIIEAYERDDSDDDGLDWREMFRRYTGIVTYHEGPDHLYEGDWTSDEWAAINALDPAAPIPALDDNPVPATIEPMPERLSPMAPNWPLLKERKT